MHSVRCATFAPDVPPRAVGPRVSTFVLSEDGPGVGVLAIPAFGLDGRSFAAIAPSLAGRRAVAWNPRNDLPRHLGLDGFARAALDAADAAGLRSPCVLLGSSFGGMVALMAALDHPGRVRGVVLIGTSPSWRALGLPMRLAARLHRWVPRRRYHLHLARIMTRGRAHPVHGDPRRHDLRQQFERRTKGYVTAVLTALRDGPSGPFDLGRRLPELQTPLLVLQGTRDHVALPRWSRVYDTARDVRRVDLPDVGHLPQMFAPDALDAPLRAFLAELDAR